MFILYLVFMLGIGIWFFVRSKNAGEKDYFLGGREMGAWVSGLSAGASDMSAWVLMGMPASIYAYGMGKAWIPVGLFIGYSLSWIFIAPHLHRPVAGTYFGPAAQRDPRRRDEHRRFAASRRFERVCERRV